MIYDSNIAMVTAKFITDKQNIMNKHFTLVIIILFCFFKVNAQIIKHDPNNYNQLFDQQKRYILKVNPFFLLKDLAFSYEQSIRGRRSLEIQIGFVGLGLQKYGKRIAYQGTNEETRINTISEGFFFSCGYKIFRTSRNLKRSPNILQGIYFKPELAFGFYNINRFTSFTPSVGSSYTIPEKKKKANYKAFLINFGSQNIIAKVVCIDFSLGIGFGVDNLSLPKSTLLYFGEEHPGIYKVEAGKSLALKAGIKIGLLFR